MQQFNIELDTPSTPFVLYAMQADSLSRLFQMTITQGGTPWTPPTGAIWTVRFGAPNMPAGWYDTITEVGGSTHPAVVVSDNVAVVEIAEQAVSMAGQNILCVLVTDATGYQIASWQFQLLVTAVPGYDAPEVTTYYNLLTEQVAQVLASQTAAAESATLAQSWAVGNTGSREGENTNNAQYWSHQAAQSAQEAVGFRTMQGGAVLPINGDIDLTQPYPTKTGGSLTVTSAANRIDSVTINGFTTQTGSGDASPSNVREIENAGEYTNVLTLDGEATITSVGTNTKGLYRITIKTPDDFEIPDSGVVVDAICNQLKPVSATAAQFSTTYGDFAAYNGTWWFFVSGDIKDIPSAQEYLTNHPIIVAYKSTQDTGKFYTGISVEQGDSYHCEIIELQAPLHEGDTLETNVQSEFDQEYVLTGQENFILQSSLNSSLFIAENITENAENYTAVSNMYINGGNTWNTAPDKSVINSNNGSLGIRDTSFSTAEAFKSALAQRYAAGNPVRVFLKSVSNGTPLRIKREEHVKKTYVFTGTENIQKSGLSNNSFYINFNDIAQNGSVGAVICNQAKALAETDIASSRIWGVSGSSNSTKTLRISSPETTADAVKAEFSAQYIAGTPFIVEYELAAPEVFADTPIIVINPQGTYTVSGETGTTCQVFMEPLQDGGDADTLNGNTWADIPVQSVNSKTGAVQLNAADVSALPQSGGVYSTSAPVNTGKVWIDGNPIYRQVFSLSSQQLPQLQYTTYIPLSSLTGLAHFVDVKAQLFIQDGGSVTQYPIILPAGLGDSVIDVQTSERGVELYRVQLAETPISPNIAYPSGNTNDIVFIVEYSKIGG